MNRAMDETKSLSKQLREVNSLLKLDPQNVDLLRQKQEILNSAVTETKNKLKLLKDTQGEVQKKWEKYAEVKPELEKLTEEIDSQEKNLKALKIQQSEATKEFKKVKTAEEQYKKANNEVEKCEQALKDVKKRQEESAEEFKKGKIASEQYIKIGDEVKECEKKLISAKTRQSEVLKEFDKSKEAEERYQKISDKVSICEENLKKLRKSKQDINSTFVTDDEWVAYQREIIETEKKLKNLTKELKNFGSVSAQKIAAAGEKIGDIGKKAEEAAKKAEKASAGAGLAIGAIVTSAVTWEDAFAGVKKTVDGTAEQMSRLEQGLLDLSKRTGSDAKDIAAVAEAAGQLGIKTEDVLSFSETMVKLGDSTNLTAENAASALAKFANITKMSSDNYGKLGSAIVDLGNNFATTESDIVDTTTRLAATGEVVGLTEPQMLAIGTALSSVGIEAEAGGSAVSKLLKKMETSVATFDSSKKIIDSTGYSLRDLELMSSNDSKSFKDLAASLGLTTTELKGSMNNMKSLGQFADVAGVSAEEFKRAYGKDAVGALSMFIGGLSDVDKNGGSAVATLQDMGLTEVRLSNAVLALASSDDVLGKALKTSNSAWGEEAALNEEAEKRYATRKSQIVQLKNTLTELAVKLGTLLLPVITQLVDGLKNMIERFTNSSSGVQKFVMIMLGVVAAAAPVLIVFGKIAGALRNIFVLVPKMLGIFGKIAGIGKSILAFFPKLLGGIKAIGTAIGAHPIVAIILGIIAALTLLYRHCEPFKNFIDGLWEKIKNFFASIPQYFQSAKDWIISAWESIKVFFTESIPNAFISFKDFVVSIFTEKIPNAIQTVVQWFSALPYKIGYAIGQLAAHIVNFALEIHRFFTVKIPEYISAMVAWFKSLPGRIKTAISSAIVNIGEWCAAMKERAVNGVVSLINKVVEWFKSLPGKIKSGIANGFNVISDWFSNMKTKAVNGVSRVATAITDGFKNLPSKLKNIGRSIVEGLWSGINNAKDWLKNKISSFATGIKDGFKSALRINSPSKAMRDEVGCFIPEGIAEGIDENADSPLRAMKRVVSALLGENDLGAFSVHSGLNSDTFGKSPDPRLDTDALTAALVIALKQIDWRLYLDGDKLVGGTLDRFNRGLNQKYELERRGG